MTKGEELISDIYDTYEQAESYDKKDVLTLFKDLINTIRNTDNIESAHQLAEDMNYWISEKVIEENLCPKCFSPLNTEIYGYEDSEAYGLPVHEPLYKKRCQYCGWEED